MDAGEQSSVLHLSSLVFLLLKLKLKLCKQSKVQRRRFWVHPILRQRQQGHYDNLFREMKLFDECLFFNYTRMSVRCFEKLLTLIEHKISKHSRRESISAGCRLAVTLTFLVTGDSYRSIGYAFRLGVPTVCNILRETCEIILEVISPLYVAPPKQMDYWRISTGFERQWSLPNCVGAIDGKHVVIQAPSNSGSQYFNYKKSFSLVLMAVCDANYNFTLVDVGAYGSESDGGVLNRSVFGQNLLSNNLDLPNDAPFPKTVIPKPYFFVADEAFPLRINIMRPYSKRRNESMPEMERIFNYRLSRARRVIENTFGVMVARFKIFHRVINGKPETVKKIVKAWICLHNFISKEHYDKYCHECYTDREDQEGNIVPGDWRKDVNSIEGLALQDSIPIRLGARNETNTTAVYRNDIKNYVNGEGADLGPWQWNNVRRT